MRNKVLTAFLLGLITALLFGYTRSWTESTPTDDTVANQIDEYNRYLRVDTAERLETYIAGFNSGDSNAGFYHVLFIENAASLSTPAANKYLLYGLLVDGKCELIGEDEDGDMIQLSYTGKHMIGSGTAPQAWMYNATEEDGERGRQSQIVAKGEQSGGEDSVLGYIEISHDGTGDDQGGRILFVVNDGNDDDNPSKIALVFQDDGSIDVGDSVAVLDEDDMASDSATHLVTQQSVAAYYGGDDPNLDDSEANPMVTAHAYLTQTAGYVTARDTTNASGEIMAAYVGNDSDPTNEACLLEDNADHSGARLLLSFFVGSGNYFEITSTISGEPTIYWTSIVSGGGLPVDQD